MTEDLTKEHWVTSVASYPNTDMVASGEVLDRLKHDYI